MQSENMHPHAHTNEVEEREKREASKKLNVTHFEVKPKNTI